MYVFGKLKYKNKHQQSRPPDGTVASWSTRPCAPLPFTAASISWSAGVLHHTPLSILFHYKAVILPSYIHLLIPPWCKCFRSRLLEVGWHFSHGGSTENQDVYPPSLFLLHFAPCQHTQRQVVVVVVVGAAITDQRRGGKVSSIIHECDSQPTSHQCQDELTMNEPCRREGLRPPREPLLLLLLLLFDWFLLICLLDRPWTG